MRQIRRIALLAISLYLFVGPVFAQDIVLTPSNQAEPKQQQLTEKEKNELDKERFELFRTIMSISDPETMRKLSDFFLVSQMLQHSFVDQRSQVDLLKLAMAGMVNGLDPYSNLFFDEDAESISKSLTGESNFVGIGTTIVNYSKNIVITEVFEDSPAAKAGLMSGDVILKVDGKDVFGMSVQKIAGLIRGEEGSNVVLEISSMRFQKPRVITITRHKVTVDSVSYKDLKNHLAYIKIRSFVPETPDKFREALKRSSDKKGLVIDLRNNGGGSLDAVTKMIGYLVGPAQIATLLRARDYNETVLTPNDSTTPVKFPAKVVLLINNNSASASEIMAGNFKYYKIATLLGVRTFGKATAQNYLGLDTPDHSMANSHMILGVTIARFYLPDGSNITGEGVQPDVEVEQPENFKVYEYGTKRDVQFSKAVEILKKK